MRPPILFIFFKKKPAYEVRISDWSSYVCSSDLRPDDPPTQCERNRARHRPGAGRRNQSASRNEAPRHPFGGYKEGEVRRRRSRTEVGLDWREIGRASCRERVCQYV